MQSCLLVLSVILSSPHFVQSIQHWQTNSLREVGCKHGGRQWNTSSGIVQRGFNIGGFVLDSCVASGTAADSFLIQGHPDKIAKIQLLTEEEEREGNTECDVAKALKLLDSTHVTQCLETGVIPLANISESSVVYYTVFQRAPGRELSTFLNEAAEITPQHFPDLGSVFERAFEMYELMNTLDGAGKNVSGHVRYFHGDMNPYNLFLDDNGQMMLIDFGRSFGCCEVPGTCKGWSHCSEKVLRRGIASNLWWLSVNIFSMIRPMPRLQVVAEELVKETLFGSHDVNSGVGSLNEHMRPKYKKDLRKLHLQGISQSDFDTFLGLVVNSARDSFQCFTNSTFCDDADAVPWPPTYIKSMERFRSAMHSLHSNPSSKSNTRPFFELARNVHKHLAGRQSLVRRQSAVSFDGTIG